MGTIKCIGILTSGGDAPGMNAAIRAVTRAAIYNGLQVKGIYRGYKGLVTGEIKEFKSQNVSNIIQLGGFYRLESSFVISFQVTPFSAINTITWYKKSEISYLTSCGSGFLAAITISVASSPTFLRILSIPLSKR